MTAAKRGDIDSIKILLACGADVHRPASNGTTALYAAAERGHLRAVLAMLAVSLCWPMAAQAQDTLSYQGQMLNAARQPITASYPMVFKLYAEREEGDVLWTESYESVDVLDGTGQQYEFRQGE